MIEAVIKRFSKGKHPERICLQDPREMKLLYETAGLVENGLIVEIGRWKGGSLVLLCLGSPSSKVISIDSDAANNQFAKALLKSYSIGRSRYSIRDATSQIVSDWDGGPIDLLLVDGCHERKAVYADLELWVPRIKKEGWLIAHDVYCHRLSGPSLAIAEYRKEHPKQFIHIKDVKTSMLLRKLV